MHRHNSNLVRHTLSYAPLQLALRNKAANFTLLFTADEYDASLMTRGLSHSRRVFIAPKTPGMYIIRLVRDDDVVLA